MVVNSLCLEVKSSGISLSPQLADIFELLFFFELAANCCELFLNHLLAGNTLNISLKPHTPVPECRLSFWHTFSAITTSIVGSQAEQQ